MTDSNAVETARPKKRATKATTGKASAAKAKAKPASRADAATAPATEPPPSTHPRQPPPTVEATAGVSLELLSPTQRDSLEKLSLNLARAAMTAQGVIAEAALRQADRPAALTPDPFHVAPALTEVMGRLAAQPDRLMRAQADLFGRYMDLWKIAAQRAGGEAGGEAIRAERGDKRFADPEWRANPYYDFLAQAYTMTSRWAGDLVKQAGDLDPHTRDKAQFYLRQLSGALSPSNFIATSPELMRATLAESGENLVRGMHMMAQDIEAGHGSLRIRQTDASKFTLGVNMAATPGKVVFRNELMELIQYAPTTAEVYKRPLLIVPPWINKFYVLDLNPDKSFVRWAVAQGHTIFVISWVNPDERHAEKDFESYMHEGVFAALEAIELATGERESSAIGYCVGGTLLSVALAYMAQTGDKRIASATLFATQVDFSDAGDLKIFVDNEQLKSVEQKMSAKGYLDGAQMAGAFNMLRPNELIWSYFVNNYLKGKEPMPFDLLVWNSDATRMPAANHSFYLRNCYLENNLTRGRMAVGGKTLDLGKVTIPIYELAAREDHIAPAKSVFVGAQYFGGPVRYVMAGSGHIAGVVNPADKPKYQYWTGGPARGEFATWIKDAVEHPGSWWPDWAAWLGEQAPQKVPARMPGEGRLKALGAAPGDYVRVKV